MPITAPIHPSSQYPMMPAAAAPTSAGVGNEAMISARKSTGGPFQGLHQLLRGLSHGRLAGIYALLNHVAEVPNEALHRPSGSISKRANGMSFHLSRHVEQQLDLALLGFS